MLLSNSHKVFFMIVDTEKAHRKEKNRIFLYDLLSPLGAESEERLKHAVFYRLGDVPQELDMEERRGSENLKLAYLFHLSTCFSGRPGWHVPREYLLDLKAGIMQ